MISSTMKIGSMRPWLIPLATVFCTWGAVIWFVNPAGEFAINDDWCYSIIIENLLEKGRISPTGWGGGGPAVLVHIAWGILFSSLFGFSQTSLRAAVLTLAVCGTLALLLLLFRLAKEKNRGIGVIAFSTLLFNPLFLSQSFTFMTDIPFAAMVIFSLCCLHAGIEKESWTWLLCGLFFALLATLTRQIGLFLPVGFLLCCLLHPKARRFDLKKLFLSTFVVTVLPWILFELLLWGIGSSPVTHHPVFQKIFLHPVAKGFPDYPGFLLQQAGIILLYCGFFLSPLLILQWRELFSHSFVRRFASIILGLFVVFEAAILGGFLDPPTGFHRNVLYDFGIGPLLLKDVYLLGVVRTWTLPPALFYLLVLGSLFSASLLLYTSWRFATRFIGHRFDPAGKNIRFIALLAFVGVIVYAGVILLSGFHDRYLIPLFVLLLVWLVPQVQLDRKHAFFPIFSSAVILLFFAGFSLFGLKDFMATKRSLHQAHTYLLNTVRVDPCDVDGGFEFNGYHCSGRNRRDSNENYSWWWVEREKYLVTLGPLPGYRTTKTFPFSRSMGPDGAVHVLQPIR